MRRAIDIATAGLVLSFAAAWLLVMVGAKGASALLADEPGPTEIHDALARVTPLEPVWGLAVDVRGNLLLTINEDFHLSDRCLQSRLEAPAGTKTVVCLETDALAQSLFPEAAHE